MKITIIGSSHGVPEAGRKCTCIMIEVGENIYFVDMGTSAIDALRDRGLSVDAVKAVFITHMHGDHTNGLIPFVDLIAWYFKTPDPEIFLPDMAAVDVLYQWLQVAMTPVRQRLRFSPVKLGALFDDGVLKVTAVPSAHCPNAFGYLLEAEGKRVLCTGDMKNPQVDFPAEAGSGLDLLIGECAHFPATEYLPVLEKYDIRRICLNHHAPRHNQSIQALQEKRPDLLIARDNMEIQV